MSVLNYALAVLLALAIIWRRWPWLLPYASLLVLASVLIMSAVVPPSVPVVPLTARIDAIDAKMDRLGKVEAAAAETSARVEQFSGKIDAALAEHRKTEPPPPPPPSLPPPHGAPPARKTTKHVQRSRKQLADISSHLLGVR